MTVRKKVACGIGGNETDLIAKTNPNGQIELVPAETGNLLQVAYGETVACVQGVAATAVEIKDPNLPLEIVGA